MNNSSLFDETTFYQNFTKDLRNSVHEVIIESPFITSERMTLLYSIFEMLVKRNVKVYIITRDPREHKLGYDEQAENEVQRLENLGVQVFICSGNHHRKLAIIDRFILWEGSLNILSQNKSKEIMRRFDDRLIAEEMFEFLRFEKVIT